MNSKTIIEINVLLKELRIYGDAFKKNKAKGTDLLPSRCSEIITKEIPSKFKELFPEVFYSTQGSVGMGRTTETPWISILDKRVGSSTQEGVYLVMLFSGELGKVYFSLAQGVKKEKKKEIIKKREDIRELLKLENDILKPTNNLDIEKDKYKISAIYSNEWNTEDPTYCERLLKEFKKAFIKYVDMKHGITTKLIYNDSDDLTRTSQSSSPQNVSFSISKMIDLINSTGLIYTSSLIKRFAFSRLSKPFVILSGLAGSGKTQLALAFAGALVEDREKQMRVVSVGADWTNREPLLGYPNALDKTEYVRPENGVLDLLVEANKPENSSKPFFLILDEMNMSYVERYFADFLSVMESHEEMPLWNGVDPQKDNTPKSVSLPENLFIIGTINVDETTYMFSPKVLDRANVIEFKISEEEMTSFLSKIQNIDKNAANSKAADMGEDFVKLAKVKDFVLDKNAANTLNKFFKELKNVNAEFGYRSATEIFRFICQAQKNDDTIEKLSNDDILDSAIVQKLLPKLHGSRKKLDPVLKKLWSLCFTDKDNATNTITSDCVDKAIYKESADKIQRMYEAANANGFTSFAEA
jgi:5-methylcytosine-specific restriction protein B